MLGNSRALIGYCGVSFRCWLNCVVHTCGAFADFLFFFVCRCNRSRLHVYISQLSRVFIVYIKWFCLYFFSEYTRVLSFWNFHYRYFFRFEFILIRLQDVNLFHFLLMFSSFVFIIFSITFRFKQMFIVSTLIKTPW